MEKDFNRVVAICVLDELMHGRTFYENYFKDQKWENLSRIDKAICILNHYIGIYDFNYPEGFIEYWNDRLAHKYEEVE